MRGAVHHGAVLAIAGAVLAAVACNQRTPIASCADDLRGVYAAGAERWMVLDHGATLEAYPLFPDGSGPAGVVAAPRWIALTRAPAAAPSTAPPPTGQPAAAPAVGLTGTLHRRYMQREALCEASTLVRLTRCADDALELELADPAPPRSFAPCVWPAVAPSRTARWRRE